MSPIFKLPTELVFNTCILLILSSVLSLREFCSYLRGLIDNFPLQLDIDNILNLEVNWCFNNCNLIGSNDCFDDPANYQLLVNKVCQLSILCFRVANNWQLF